MAEIKKPTVAEFMKDPAILEAAKEKHATVKKIDVILKDGTKEPFIIAQPTRTISDMLSKYLNDDNNIKAREVLNANCILAGNMDVVTDPINTVAAETIYSKITELLNKFQVEEKEL
jgi:hypothetical protein